LPEHYFLPEINVTFSSIPKTGCTTLKNFLFNLEQLSGQNKPYIALSDSYIGQDIHRPKFMRDYSVPTLKGPEFHKSLKILVLRNPYHRIRSAWTNKLLFAQHDYRLFQTHMDEDFTPVDFSSVQELSEKFEKFTQRLHADREFMKSDAHWLPQVEFFGKVSDYDVVLETSELAKLERLLEYHLSLTKGTLDKALPRFNETASKLVTRIGTERAWDLIASTYKDDFDALSQAGLSAGRPDSQFQQGSELSEHEMAIEKDRIRESRRQSEVRRLKIDLADHDEIKRIEFAHLEKQIEDIKNSWSWRLTAWLRWLSSPLAKFLRNWRSR